MVIDGVATRVIMHLLPAAMVTSLACAEDPQLHITSVDYSSMYVISDVSIDNKTQCLENDTIEPNLHDLFNGVEAGALCEFPSQGSAWTQCMVKATYLTMSQDALMVESGGAGGTTMFDDGHAFSRHITHSILSITSTQDTTVGINWMLQASGLGTSLVRLRNSAGEVLLQHEINSYIFPESEEGVFHADLDQQETWTLTIYTDLQAMHQGQDEPKFDIGDARATFVMVSQSGLPGDINNDGLVDGVDLSLVLQNWGRCKGCPADTNDDGIVDGADLAIVLSTWTY